MTKRPERRNLGRGLSALLGDIEAPVATDGGEPEDAGPTDVQRPAATPAETRIPLDKLRPNPDQPRRDFAEAELEELASSIRERGVIQPVVVRPDPLNPGTYQLVAGERRWRAAQRAQLHEIPAVVRELDDRTVLEVALIENVQRADLNPIEEALGYSQLIEKFSHTQEELARIVGKSRPHVANLMRLLSLPDQVQRMVRQGKLTSGHARALINAADPVALAEQAVLRGLSVRQVEELARRVPRPPASGRPARTPEKDADTRVLEGDLSAAIGMKVEIAHGGPDGSGEVRIRYRSLDDLDRLCQKLAE
ncbi:MAG TPA: ParB/RepB/Spo0J family partition protein [Thermohalobaculum sp.]|nr:ParB/RepB/Spo0J family partition protein [Thermohalobaculum sp.]